MLSPVSPEGAASPFRLFVIGAIAMSAITIAGFTAQLLAGRSSFGAPPKVHAHAVVFMGWLAIYVAQSLLAMQGSKVWRRRLGWLAMVWLPIMLFPGSRFVVDRVRRGEEDAGEKEGGAGWHAGHGELRSGGRHDLLGWPGQSGRRFRSEVIAWSPSCRILRPSRPKPPFLVLDRAWRALGGPIPLDRTKRGCQRTHAASLTCR